MNKSIIQSLYSDVLLYLFDYLHFSIRNNPELPNRNRLLPAILTCKLWYQTSLKMKSRKLNFIACSSDKLQSLCLSPLKKHVTKLNGGFSIADFSYLRS